MWLDSSVGVFYDASDVVTAWKDQSGQGNNASLIAPCYDTSLQLAECQAPVKDPATLNGRDTLRIALNGKVSSYLSLADTPILQFGMGDFAIFVVARYSNLAGTLNGAGLGYFWSKGQAPDVGDFGKYVAFRGNGQSIADLESWQSSLLGNQAVGATSGLNDNQFRRYGTTRRGSDLVVWVDGSLDGKTTLPSPYDVSGPGIPVHVGGPLKGAGGGLIGNMAEVVAVKGTLSDAQIAQLDAYLKAKWAL